MRERPMKFWQDNAKDGARLKLEKVAGSDIWYILPTEEKSSLFRVGEKSI